jgi:hypothetical protein
MRIRTIKPEFFTHEGLFELESETGLPIRVAFAGLWCAADREGRFKWEPRRLGVQILPYDQADFSRVLHALATRGFVCKYASGTNVFGVIPSFTSHQVINNREKESEIPEPLEYIDPDACPTRAPRVPHADTAEGKGMEGNKEGKERGAREKHSSKTKGRTRLREEFDAYFREVGLYPRDAEATWNGWEGNGWTNKGKKIECWKSTVRAWKARGYMPSVKDPRDNEPNWPSERQKLDYIREPEEEDLIGKFYAACEAEVRAAAGDHPDYEDEPAEIETEEDQCF